ncbi:MAG: DMT family transporter [Deltaproteobacteria bacterium]|nr:DMT family transporter [Deltaproteobacteria bacterium]
MTRNRRPADASLGGIMLVLCAVWGVQQVVIKVAAPDLPAILQVALRSGISALLVGATLRIRGERLAGQGATLLPGLLAGGLFAAEFLFVAEGLRYTDASHMSVFLYTAPVFTALGLHLRLPSERLSGRQWAGVAISFCGIALAFAGGWMRAELRAQMLLGDLLGVLAGIAWGATTVVVRGSRLSEAPAGLTLLYQLATGFVLLSLAGLAMGQASRVTMTPVAWASLLFQGVVVSFASYLAWFALLRRYLASHLAVLSFMTPLFGVSAGALFLGERLDPLFLAGAALVLGGIGVVMTASRSRR